MECPDLTLHELITAREPDEVAAQVYEAMKNTRDECIRQGQFLISRPDISVRVRELTLGNTWVRRAWKGTAIGDAIVLPTDSLFEPLMQHFTELLRHLRVESLTLHYLALDVSLMSEVSRQPLSLLNIRQCTVTTELQQAILNSSLQSAIPRLHIGIIAPDPGDDDDNDDDDNDDDDPPEFATWCLVALCPQLRLLYCHNPIGSATLPMPESRFWPSFVALNAIERLHLDGIDWDIDPLIEMFRDATARGPLRVTHLKLAFLWGVSEDLLLDFFRVLHAGQAPLSVLAVDGIYPLTTNLFHGLASMFRDIVSLTIIRRDGIRQRRAMLCRWVQPVYKFAEAMRPLTKLRHFAANFGWAFGELSPSVMRLLEPDYDPSNQWATPMADDYMADATRSCALPFVANLPALELFVVTSSGPVAITACSIERSEGGAYEVKRIEKSVQIDPEFNPTSWGATFPLPAQPEIAHDAAAP